MNPAEVTNNTKKTIIFLKRIFMVHCSHFVAIWNSQSVTNQTDTINTTKGEPKHFFITNTKDPCTNFREGNRRQHLIELVTDIKRNNVLCEGSFLFFGSPAKLKIQETRVSYKVRVLFIVFARFSNPRYRVTFFPNSAARSNSCNF